MVDDGEGTNQKLYAFSVTRRGITSLIALKGWPGKARGRRKAVRRGILLQLLMKIRMRKNSEDFFDLKDGLV